MLSLKKFCFLLEIAIPSLLLGAPIILANNSFIFPPELANKLRLHLYLEVSQVVPFDYLPALKSAFHLWTGHNPALHDGLSLYSYSWLHGGRAGRGAIRFACGGCTARRG